jgi:hypothetical protein
MSLFKPAEVSPPDQAGLTYSQNARPIGFPLSLTLEPTRLVVDALRKVDYVDLAQIEQIRLTHEPKSFITYAFRTTLNLKSGKTLSYSSISWKSMIDAQKQDASYAPFTRNLIAAVAIANPSCRFVAGRPFLSWLLISVLAGIALLGAALFTFSAVISGAWVAALLGLSVSALGFWQLEPMVRLNKPRRFQANAIPAPLLP